ncbi:RluA family pseudouridine synthase [Xanthocytophaga agilis]|uniref:RluA family pseudouridine synthase n=1 Tax=Xanthocytophaga agilis TaxID=3048010 RepID=A0AAE3UFS0_9BACT|nr:RluA family pseudouridine synthase [Xanthocytophaga agilis]MDJ1500883.1 RluA family pseudouridine synthase [Xanthocytophaga agilis]
MIPFTVIYEDNHLIVVNKASGVLVQPDKNGDPALEQLIKQYIKEKYTKSGEVFLGVVHRLDRPVSGLVIFAKTSKALVRMNELFKQRDIEKVYWAVVGTMPAEPEGKLVHWITRSEKSNLSKAHKTEVKGSLRAELQYKLIQRSDRYSLLEVHLMTGRHHQIRAQLSAIGCPIVGDLKYGFARSSPDGSIFLHSRYTKFIHPVQKEEIILEAPMPELWHKYGMK